MNHDYINKFNLIDQYVLGKLAEHESEEFENHFIDCPECVERLNTARSFVHDLKRLAVQETLFSAPGHASQTRRWQLKQLVPLRGWAVITCCCIVVAGVFAFFAVRRLAKVEAELRQAKEDASAISQQYQRGVETAAESEKQHQQARQELTQRFEELERKLKTDGGVSNRARSSVRGSQAPEVNFPIYALVSVVRGQVQAPVDVAPPASSSRFALSIPVEDRRDFSVYRIVIMDHQGTAVWKKSGFRPDAYHALSLSLSSNFLKPGIYDLRVEGLTPSDLWSTVGSYPFRVARRH